MGIRGFIEAILYYGLEYLGRYYSSYRGFVVDNDDPEGFNRIQVKVPIVSRYAEHPVWAYQQYSFSGPDYGMQVLPQIGDMVMIQFDHGDPKFPMWSHAHFTENEKPEEFQGPQVYGFKSPKGQIIVIDDRDGKEQIIINHGENEGLVKVIELTEKLNNIETKINNFLAHYRVHQVVDPISGMAGPILPAPPAPIDLIETQQKEIENEDVLH